MQNGDQSTISERQIFIGDSGKKILSFELIKLETLRMISRIIYHDKCNLASSEFTGLFTLKQHEQRHNQKQTSRISRLAQRVNKVRHREGEGMRKMAKAGEV